MSKKPIIIDTDPGIDDAAAISIALNSPELEVRLLSTVSGNVNVDHTTDNALKLATFFKKDVPVARGFAQPLLVPYEDASYIHGESGMEGYDFPKPDREEIASHAVEAMHQEIMNSSEKITLMPIGALTNVGILLTMYPEVKEKLTGIVLMGGSVSNGNVSSSAEFNIYADPHAAQMVFQSGLPVTMVGLDVTEKAVLGPEELNKIKSYGKTGEMLYSMFEHYRGGDMISGLQMHDVCAVCYIEHPEFFTTKAADVEVVTGEPGRGTTVARYPNFHFEDIKANTNVCVDVDVDAFRKWVLERLGSIEN